MSYARTGNPELDADFVKITKTRSKWTHEKPVVSFQISQDLARQLEAFCNKNDITWSAACRAFISDGLVKDEGRHKKSFIELWDEQKKQISDDLREYLDMKDGAFGRDAIRTYCEMCGFDYAQTLHYLSDYYGMSAGTKRIGTDIVRVVCLWGGNASNVTRYLHPVKEFEKVRFVLSWDFYGLDSDVRSKFFTAKQPYEEALQEALAPYLDVPNLAMRASDLMAWSRDYKGMGVPTRKGWAKFLDNVLGFKVDNKSINNVAVRIYYKNCRKASDVTQILTWTKDGFVLEQL